MDSHKVAIESSVEKIQTALNVRGVGVSDTNVSRCVLSFKLKSLAFTKNTSAGPMGLNVSFSDKPTFHRFVVRETRLQTSRETLQ